MDNLTSIQVLEQGKEYTLLIEKDTTLVDHGATTHITVAPHALLKYITTGSAQRSLVLLQDAHLDWIDASVGTSTTMHSVLLQEEHASAKFRSIFLGKDQDQYTTTVTMIHKASHTTSKMLTRAVLLDKSKGKYRGHVQIVHGAKNCNAQQREDTLLLGNHAMMDAEPVLEINNNDVKCSHGVSIGRADEEKLYYLESRGIAHNNAKAMLVQGFFDQMFISMGEHGAKLREQIAALLE